MSGEYFLANRMGIEPGKPIAGSEFADCSGRTRYISITPIPAFSNEINFFLSAVVAPTE